MCWLYSIFWVTLPFFGPNSYVLEAYQMSCTFDYISLDPVVSFIMFAMFFGGFIIPVFIITISYTFILVRLKGRRKMLNLSDEATSDSKPSTMVVQDDESTTDNENGKMVSVKKQNTAIISVIMFVLAWSPYAAVCILAQISSNREEYVTPHTTSLPAMFAKSSAIYNPIIYVFTNRKFQSAVKKLFPITETIIREPSRSTGSDIHRVKFSANDTYVAIQTNAQAPTSSTA